MRKRSKFREGDICRIVVVLYSREAHFLNKLCEIVNVSRTTSVFLTKSFHEKTEISFTYQIRMLDTGEMLIISRDAWLKREEKRKHVGKVVARNVGIL